MSLNVDYQMGYDKGYEDGYESGIGIATKKAHKILTQLFKINRAMILNSGEIMNKNIETSISNMNELINRKKKNKP